MNKQTIMWTVLPNGITTEGGGGLRLRLSLLVSPRLETTEGGVRPTLDPLFPDFLKWPELVKTLKFQVLFEGRRAIEVSPNPEALSPELWPAIFKPDTYVKPHKNRDLSNLEVVSYPVRNVLGRVKEVYQEVAVESPVVLPRFEGDGQRALRMHGLLRDIAPNQQRATQIRGQLATRLQPGRVRALRTPAYESPTSLSTPLEMRAARPAEAPLVPGVSPATVDFHQFRDFHSSLIGKRAPLPTVAALVASVDFHQIVASLAQYPLLMRRLGLVIDLEVPFEAGLAGAQRVRARPMLPTDPNKPHLSPWTNIVLDNQRFAARLRSANSDLADGMMRLDDTSRFEVGQIDVDGAAMKTLQLAEKAAVVASARLAPGALRPGAPPRGGGGTDTPAAAPPSPPESEEAALPSLRSGGLWVARTNRAPLLAAALARVMELNEAVAQDKPDEGSLYAEDLVRGYRVDVWDEQAKRWFSLCQRVGRYHFLEPDKALTLEDEGWVSSATAEPPEQPNRLCVHEALFRWQGWSLVAPRPGGAVKNESGAVEATDKFGLEVSFRAKPQSLPRLRFGREYRLRARAVDLAGNGPALEQADDAHATPPITYFRSEPVLAPVVIPRTPLADSPGESVDTIVIRSRNDDPSKDKVPVDDRSERHLAPPRTSQLMAEMHGMFDADGGMKGDPATYKLIVEKDRKPADFYDVGQLQLPYLPDPLAFGLMVRLRRLPSSDNPPPKPVGGSPPGRVFRQPVARRFFFEEPKDEILQIPFGEDWPELKPVRLLLYEPKEATAKMEFEETQRLLRVPLPKAEAAEIWLSCYLKPTAIPRMQMWRWTVEGVAAPSVRKANLPAGQALQVHRQLHDPQQLPKWSGTVALPAAEVQTLQRLNMQAVEGRNWLLTPYRRLMLVHATQQPLGKPQFQHLAAVKAIGNTYATLEDDVKVSGKSSIRLDIVASWEEPLDPLAEPKPRVLKGEARVCEIPLDRDDATIPLGQRHEFGDTKYRAVTYKAIATTRYREYFQVPGKPQNLPMTRTSAERTVDVLSSARPAAPKILYVIPAFGWDKTDRPDGVTSKRQGGWLRVYLERPWYSSGEGEELGVVLAPPPPAVTIAALPAIPDALRPYVTQWGIDPIWRAGTMRAWPELGDFQGTKDTETGLSLDEVAGAKVSVAGYEVFYDEERQLWYADINIDAGEAYYPFVRLALARYQPKSVKADDGDVKLSRVVLADFAQLAPDRSVTLTYDRQDKKRIAVSVAGPSYLLSAGGRGPGTVEVVVEQKSGAGGGTLAWVPIPDSQVTLKGAASGQGGVVLSGEVILPGDRGGGKYRLAIREYETLLADAPPKPALVAAGPALEPAQRLVFADVLEV